MQTGTWEAVQYIKWTAIELDITAKQTKNPTSNNGHGNVTKTKMMSQYSKSKLHLFIDVKFLECLSPKLDFLILS